MKIGHIFALFPGSPATWSQEMVHRYQKFFFWYYQRNQNYSPSYLGFSSPCTLSLCLGTYSSCWLSALTPAPTPKYFFLSNLSFVDICFIFITIPKMLWNIQTQTKIITFANHISQVCFFTIFAGLDGFLLAVMADDCFVTICPAALHCHHESPVLWTVHAGVLDDECPDFLVTKLNDVVGVL